MADNKTINPPGFHILTDESGIVRIEPVTTLPASASGIPGLPVYVVDANGGEVVATDVIITGPLGSKVSASSVSVVIASDQGAVAVTGTVAGTLQHNHAAPISNNIGALVAIANAVAPTYTEGDQVLLSTDLAGNIRTSVTAIVADQVDQGNKGVAAQAWYTQDVSASSTASAPSVQAVGTSSGSILATNAARKEAIIVNTGTTILYLGLGQVPTNTAYHIALAACTIANDGSGGTFVSDLWKGAINAISSAVSGAVVVTELT